MLWRARPNIDIVSKTVSGGLLAWVLVGGCGSCGSCQPPAPEPASLPIVAAEEPASVPATLPVNTATVVAHRGKVEVMRSGGTWSPVNVGDKLDVKDAIRTADDGEIDLAVNDMKLRIHEHSEFTMKKLTDSAIRGRLTGRMESEVAKGKGQIEIEADGSDAVVRTDGGHFSMITNGRGVVAVANISGGVSVAAHGKQVDLAEGQVSHVLPGSGPDAPSRALRNVLLAVEWPEAKLTNRTEVQLSGKVEIGSRVTIQGKVIQPNAKGEFTTQVTLRPGKQQLAVVATDVLGRKKKQATTVTHDAKAPHVKMKGKLWH